MAHLLTDRSLSATTRGALYEATVHATLLHGAECWNPSKTEVEKLESWQGQLLVRMARCGRRHCLPHATAVDHFDVTLIEHAISRRRLQWYGHVMRMEPSRIPRTVLGRWGALRHTKRPQNWLDRVAQDVEARGLALSAVPALVADREEWRKLARALPKGTAAQADCQCSHCGLTLKDPATLEAHADESTACKVKASAMGLLALSSPSATPSLRCLTEVYTLHRLGHALTSSPAAPTAPSKKHTRGKGKGKGTGQGKGKGHAQQQRDTQGGRSVAPTAQPLVDWFGGTSFNILG
jgi:hypothetical protein